MSEAVSFETLINKLEIRLQEDLPGQKAQLKMAPSHRSGFPESREQAKLSSVLILLYPFQNSIYTALIKRASYNGHHSGQISFPGGKFEKKDKSLVDTAIREASEEIGVNYSDIRVLGNISSLYIPVSNMMVLPVVGFSNQRPDFKHDPVEVDRIIEVDLKELSNPFIVKSKEIKIENREIAAPFYDIHNLFVWGATAMIISEFLEILK
jgi:8-oxo-dGTP pyrophosphatase MutT (NUDIX family)